MQQLYQWKRLVDERGEHNGQAARKANTNNHSIVNDCEEQSISECTVLSTSLLTEIACSVHFDKNFTLSFRMSRLQKIMVKL